MTARFAILARLSGADRRAMATAVAEETGLRIVADHPSALVLADRAAQPCDAGGPLAIGNIFTVSGEDFARNGFADGDLLRSPEAALTEAWGGYVLMFDDGERGFRLLRDPTGAQPCYYRETQDAIVIASDLRLLDVATRRSLGLNWNEIARLLIEVDLRGPETALTGTRELLPGHLLTIRPAATLVSQLWSPWDYARLPHDVTAGELAAGLRQRITTVIDTMAGYHDHAVSTVSGGLDSSIVALTLAGRTDLTCLTLATADPSGDERRYARLIAEATASRYREHFLDIRAVDLSRSQAEHLPRPTGRTFLVPMIHAVEGVMRETGATAVFNGTGGDNVFCFLQSATPAADRLTSAGLLGAAATVADIARLTGASVPKVTVAALRRAMQGSRPRPWQRVARFMSTEVVRATPAYAHPWLQAPIDARLGTGAHVVMLLRIQNYLDPWKPTWPGDVINPLLAQPIVEHCLSIASWHWCRGGRDRAIAREAFADQLPAAIMQRTWKGGPDGFIAGIVDRNRATIRDILLDGMLASRGLVDRAAIAEALDDRRPLAVVDAPRLLLLTDAEAWVRAHA